MLKTITIIAGGVAEVALSAALLLFAPAASGSAVMVGHVAIPAVDSQRVATLSSKMVEGVPRGQLGHA